MGEVSVQRIKVKRTKVPSICSFRLEKEFNEEITLGVDEAGRGPLAGPVVVAGVVFSREFWNSAEAETLEWLDKIDDSKRLRESTRESLDHRIKSHALAYHIVEIDAPMIDQINILQATFRAAREVVAEIENKLNKRVGLVMFDGPYKIPMLDQKQHCVIEGDRISKSIAAASILAKVHRDHLMKKYDQDYPEYGFASHKGYGTRQHLEAIEQCGMTLIHRRSFLKKIVAQDLGRTSEDAVAKRIEKDGFRIVARNWRMPSAEIDIVAEKDNVIHFFEVRSRARPADLQALFSKSKQKQVEHAIQLYFLKSSDARGRRFRVHLVTVIAGEIDFIWDVFKF